MAKRLRPVWVLTVRGDIEVVVEQLGCLYLMDRVIDVLKSSMMMMKSIPRDGVGLRKHMSKMSLRIL